MRENTPQMKRKFETVMYVLLLNVPGDHKIPFLPLVVEIFPQSATKQGEVRIYLEQLFVFDF